MNRTPASPLLSPKNIKTVIKGDQIHRVQLNNGELCVFKPNRTGNDGSDAYVAKTELELYRKFACLQGHSLPVCHGVETMDGETGLVLEDCGSTTFMNPPPGMTRASSSSLCGPTASWNGALQLASYTRTWSSGTLFLIRRRSGVRFIDIETWGSTDLTPPCARVGLPGCWGLPLFQLLLA